MLPGSLGITLDTIKVLYADAQFELHALRRELAKEQTANEIHKRTIEQLREKLSKAPALEEQPD